MMTRRALILVALGSALPLLGEKEMTTLQIEVKDLQGKPVDRAAVVVRFVEGRSKAKFGKKNQD
jgi:hypothetical protein